MTQSRYSRTRTRRRFETGIRPVPDLAADAAAVVTIATIEPMSLSESRKSFAPDDAQQNQHERGSVEKISKSQRRPRPYRC
ncbi:hypothetical protein MESS2_10011 [Mesorhizobium metallidurans STM 2683]|uniref:Uncharacterized protein n=2 Tax=Mesorhizobium TaxID=68287 RepID=M5EF79_9HYPH|nr:hypothetical protein MESS2_10011 [Mesorhizobium metallidurans STM 2683]